MVPNEGLGGNQRDDVVRSRRGLEIRQRKSVSSFNVYGSDDVLLMGRDTIYDRGPAFSHDRPSRLSVASL